MKNKKKKLLIFLLSAACLTAGAFGIAACKKDNGGADDDRLKNAYEVYVRNVGEDALGYDEWLALIQKDISPNEIRRKSIITTAVDADGRMTLTYADDTAQAVGKLVKNLVITYFDGNTATINLPSPSASAAKKEVNADMKNAYEQYAQAAGDGALPYDDWAELIKNDVMTDVSASVIESAYINNRCELVLTYADGTTAAVGTFLQDWEITFADGSAQTAHMPVLYIVTAVDQNGDAVRNVWIQLNYYDTETYVSVSVGNAKTDAYGNAYFALSEEEVFGNDYADYCKKQQEAGETALSFEEWMAGMRQKIKYQTRLADEDEVKEAAVPSGYELDLGKDPYGTNITRVGFDENRRALLTFNYAPDSFATSEKHSIKYTREYNGYDHLEKSSPTELTLDKDRYGYFVFKPYVAPILTGKTAAEAQKYTEESLKAATGRYRISVKASAGTAVTYHYYGNTMHMTCDAKTGVPSLVNKITGAAPAGADNASLYTGTDYIELNLYSDIARGENVFGVRVSEACTVTVTVQRISDATEPPEITVIKIESGDMSGPILSVPEPKPAGKTLTLVPADGSATIVKGLDNYYHVGSATGPKLLINLTQTLSRVGTCAIRDLPNQKIDGGDSSEGEGTGGGSGGTVGESVFIFVSKYNEEGFITEKVDYNEVVKLYSAGANADGVHPVTEDLYKFLQYFGGKCMGAADTAREYWYLLPCQYYA